MLLSINLDHPEPRKVRRAVDALLSGAVIAYPTDTVYGLGCDLTNKHAIDRLYAIKRMDRSHPLAFVCIVSRTPISFQSPGGGRTSTKRWSGRAHPPMV